MPVGQLFRFTKLDDGGVYGAPDAQIVRKPVDIKNDFFAMFEIPSTEEFSRQILAVEYNSIDLELHTELQTLLQKYRYKFIAQTKKDNGNVVLTYHQRLF